MPVDVGSGIGVLVSGIARWLYTLGPVVLFLFTIGLVLLARRLMTHVPLRNEAFFVYYDPHRNRFARARLVEVTQGIYVSRDGSIIGIVPSGAVPAEYIIGKERFKAYHAYRFGPTLVALPYGMELALMISVNGVKDVREVKSVADILQALYDSGRVEATLEVTPNVSLLVAAKPEEVGRVLSYSYGRMAGETIVDLTALTARRAEFERHVKALYEIEAKKMETIAGTVVKILVAILLVVAAIAIITHLAG